MHHAMRVNGCTEKEWKSHVIDSFRIWRERSKKSWTLDLGDWENYDPRDGDLNIEVIN